MPTIRNPERNAPPLPGRILEFRILHEDWSRYELLGTEIQVWVRVCAARIYETFSGIAPGGVAVIPGAIALANGPGMTTVMTPDELRGPPIDHPPTVMEMTHGGQIAKFRSLAEPDNLYLLPGGRGEPARVVGQKVIASQMRLFTDKYDPDGYPMVTVTWGVVPIPPRDATVEELGT
jgi:hypothetical protein